MIETKGVLEIVRKSIFKRVIQFRETENYANTDLTGKSVTFEFPSTDGNGVQKGLTILAPAQLGNATLELDAQETEALQLGCEQNVIVTETKDGEDEVYTIPVNIVDATF